MKRVFGIFSLILILIGISFANPSVAFADYTFKSPEKEINRISNKQSVKPSVKSSREDVAEYIINKCKITDIVSKRGTFYSSVEAHLSCPDSQG
jgi:hypothetical protein